MESICIFNGFWFHYEMYGYIFNFAKNNNYHVDVYTRFDCDFGFLDFYKNNFNNIKFIEVGQYPPENNYIHIFLTTDDDYSFIPTWINERVICINHWFQIRYHGFKKYINVNKFLNSNLDYAINCYPLISSQEKKENKVVTIVGGSDWGYGIDILNKLKCDTLNIICRNINYSFDLNYNVNIYNSLDTTEMFNILNNSNYVLLVPRKNNKNFNIGMVTSGSIGLAFTTLCKLIIPKDLNEILNFKNCLEYDPYSTDPIELTPVDFEEIEKERNNHIQSFDKIVKSKIIIPKHIYQTWETKDFHPEFQKFIDTWKINNPGYTYHLYDRLEREEFIKNNFNEDVYDVYTKIIPGAYKADLWRYCILYKYGGIYVDIDSLCIGNLDNFIKDFSMVFMIDFNTNHWEGQHNVANGFIAITPESPIMLNCINKIIYNVLNGIIPPSKLDFSGPGMLGRCINNYLNLPETNSFVGKEGNYPEQPINFLKFEENTEYVKNLNGDILFQNKNGNQEIINLYNTECSKVNSINWCSANIIFN